MIILHTGCFSSLTFHFSLSSFATNIAGLQRCGKSCRLRWINYLRPDLKRGSFTEQEERIIIDIHRILGNRWAQIAKHLPGRTDNEVKNFWNSCIKKKLIARGIDPNTHNLISPTSCAQIYTNSTYSNACNKLPHQVQLSNSPVFLADSHMKEIIKSPHLTSPFNNVSSLDLINTTQYSISPSILHEISSLLPASEYQNPNQFWTLPEQNPHASSMESANPCGFGLIDENNGLLGGSCFEITETDAGKETMLQPLMIDAQQEKVCEVGNGKITNELNDNGQNMNASFERADFDFDDHLVESTALSCGMYCNFSPIMNQFAWD